MRPALSFSVSSDTKVKIWATLICGAVALITARAAELSAPVRQSLEERVQTFEPPFGYLTSVLKELAISPESQLLVFSKTSGQREHISPGNPRAIYFNDQAYVAFVPGAPLLEISCVDPKEGAVFYTVDQRAPGGAKLVRRDQCLECHTSAHTLHVPGYLVRSYATDGQGVIDLIHGYSMVDHRTPIEQRWGGWYICGRAGTGPLGATDAALGTSQLALFPLGQAALNHLVDVKKYPRDTSDIVALLVLEHQAQMQNLITQLHREADRESGSETLSAEVKAAANVFVRYLLFADEATLKGPIAGASEFAAAFTNQGPTDKQGRSLRQFDLNKRLFRYPCSYMIYSQSFQSLPRVLRLHIYRRMWSVLNGEENEPAWAHSEPETRRAILEILSATAADLPVAWKL